MTKHIKARIAGREAAHVLHSILDWEDGTGADYAESLLKELADLLPKRPPPEPPKPKWNAAQLAATIMPFGKHKEWPFEGIPRDYLHWLVGEMETLLARLRAYLESVEN